ncbi:MAG TPA: isochorismatase family cysteine hydrolase [Calidithermus sp.]|nr:isochorismatase family cysteine hydrolase [Calidithermus sp.]
MRDPVFPGFEFPLAREAALLVIDMQPCGVAADAGLIRAIEAGRPGYTQYLVDRVRDIVIPNLRRLAAAFRSRGRPVYFTAFASAAGDGSDILTATIRVRDRQRRAATGASVVLPRSHPATDIVPELGPGPGDVVLTKTSMDAFASTPLAGDLRARAVRSLVVGGVLTDACVESSARHAAELGFEVTVVEDACAAWRPEFHLRSLESLGRYFARIATTDEVLAEFSRLESSSG